MKRIADIKGGARPKNIFFRFLRGRLRMELIILRVENAIGAMICTFLVSQRCKTVP